MRKLLIQTQGPTSDHGSGGGDSRDDFPCDLLRLLEIRFVNGVVARAKIRGSCNECHMEVGIIVLLKVNGFHAPPIEAFSTGQAFDQLFNSFVLFFFRLMSSFFFIWLRLYRD